MALSYCEVCGVLIKGGGQDLPEGVICDDCFDSRRVDVPEESGMDSVSGKEPIQFECPYCHAVLRVSVNVGKRTNIRCPRCAETFYSEADGSVKARLEGNTTQVIHQEELLPELTPREGQSQLANLNATNPLGPSGTQPMRHNPTGTQPIRSMSSTQPLEALSGGFMGHKPGVVRPGSSDAHDGPELKLLPEEVTISDVRRKTARALNLRASDEGRLDLDTESLKKKTRSFKKGAIQEEAAKAEGKGRKTTGRRKKTGRAESERKKGGAAKATGRKTGKRSARDSDKVKRTASGRLDKSSGTIKREKKVTAARSKAEALEAETSRRALRWGLGLVAVFLPLAISLFFARLGHRQAALVRADHPVGKVLATAGRQSDRAVRSLNELVSGLVPDLPPERPAGGTAPVGSASDAPVTTR